MNKHNKILLRFIKQVFLGLLGFGKSLASVFKVPVCKQWTISLNNEWCLAGPMLINLKSKELHYYLPMVSLDRRNRSCNNLDNLDNLSNKTGDVNLNVFDVIAGKNKSYFMWF